MAVTVVNNYLALCFRVGMVMLNYIVLSKIMLRFDNLILQVATVKWQLKLTIIICSLLWGCDVLVEYGDVKFNCVM